jgi:hypothetical protein
MVNNIKTKEMNYEKFIEKLNELQDKGLLDVATKYDIFDLGQALHQEGFERGLKIGREVEKRYS